MENIFSQDNQDSIEIIQRKLKSFTQRILLLDIAKGENNDVFFKILGSTNKEYDIHVWLDYDILKCDCTCPDNKYRKIECKHILWLSLKKFEKQEIKNWTVNDINNLYYNWYSVYCYPNGRNDICPICYDNINYEKENTISCYHGCNNSVHSLCWNKYHVLTGKTKCVICRKLTMPIIYD